MITTDLYTPRDVLAALQRVVDRDPEAVNPTGPIPNSVDRGCVYTDPEDPDRHCVAGTVLLELGCRLPSEGTRAHVTPDYGRFTYEALRCLTSVQCYADFGPEMLRDGRVKPLPWRVVNDWAQERFRA